MYNRNRYNSSKYNSPATTEGVNIGYTLPLVAHAIISNGVASCLSPVYHGVMAASVDVLMQSTSGYFLPIKVFHAIIIIHGKQEGKLSIRRKVEGK